MTLFDLNHKAVQLERQFAGGGEAYIWTLFGNPASVAKIYKSPSSEYAGKLAAMVARRPVDPSLASGHRSICWPESLLFDSSRQCQGFVMPRVDLSRNVPVFKLSNPGDRRRTAPDFTWKYLVTMAGNIARVVDAINNLGYVIGDINESNFLVADDARVTLVDCDSMQVPRPAGGYYRCRVAKPEFYAPELQGHHPPDIDRKIIHDSFALAVLLFQILMEGFHPFQGVWKGPLDLSIEERIQKGLFSYAGGNPMITPPPAAPPFDHLPKSLQTLFVRCFKDGHQNPSQRPSATEWKDALISLTSRLAVCSFSSRHVYSNHLSRCAWCYRTSKIGFDAYPAPSAPRAVSKTPALHFGATGPAAAGATFAGTTTPPAAGFGVTGISLPPAVNTVVANTLNLARAHPVVSGWVGLTVLLSRFAETHALAALSSLFLTFFLVAHARRFSYWLLLPLLWAAYMSKGTIEQRWDQYHVSFYLADGRVALGNKNLVKALAACQSAIEARPSDHDAQDFCTLVRGTIATFQQSVDKARVDLDSGKISAAAQEAQSLLKWESGSTAPDEILKQAQSALQQIKQLDRTGQQMFANGNLPGADAQCLDLQKISKVEPPVPDFCRAVSDTHVAHARSALSKSDYATAAREADMAAEMDSTNRSAATAREDIRTDAQRAYDSAMAKADMAFALRDYSSTEAAVQQALSIYPANPQALSLLERVQTQRDRALKIDRFLLLARTAVSRADWDSALTNCRAAMQLEPTNREADSICRDANNKPNEFIQAMATARQQRQARNYASALTLVNRALAIHPNDRNALELKSGIVEDQRNDTGRRPSIVPNDRRVPAPFRPTPGRRSIDGRWSGRYACGSGFRPVQLSIRTNGNRLVGESKYTDSFATINTGIDGTIDVTGRFEIHFNGVHANAPGQAEGFRGTVNLDTGQMVGYVMGRNCGSFVLRRAE
jgi:tetratricopeptide (TPR) repeat protein